METYVVVDGFGSVCVFFVVAVVVLFFFLVGFQETTTKISVFFCVGFYLLKSNPVNSVP